MNKVSTSGGHRGAVLVTGCSSGIGKATAFGLAKAGYTVFAAVRREEQAEQLRREGPAGLVPLGGAELSRPGGAADLASRVREELAKPGAPLLRGLVHNAGAGQLAPVELLDLEALRRELEVRLLSPIALTQALLPELRRTPGRIVFIATPALMPLAFNLPIHACDFFVNCLARTLAQELAPQGIDTTLVRCGGIRTSSPERTDQKLVADLERWPRQIADLYRPALEAMRRELREFDARRTPPEEVAATVERVLAAPKPPRRVQVGHMARAAALLELFPQAAQDLILGRRSHA